VTGSLLTAVVLRFDVGAHQFLIDWPPIGCRINGDLFCVRSAATVGAQRIQDAPQVLINFQSLQQCRFTKKANKKTKKPNALEGKMNQIEMIMTMMMRALIS
jgi:hypothetical protein